MRVGAGPPRIMMSFAVLGTQRAARPRRARLLITPPYVGRASRHFQGRKVRSGWSGRRPCLSTGGAARTPTWCHSGRPATAHPARSLVRRGADTPPHAPLWTVRWPTGISRTDRLGPPVRLSTNARQAHQSRTDSDGESACTPGSVLAAEAAGGGHPSRPTSPAGLGLPAELGGSPQRCAGHLWGLLAFSGGFTRPPRHPGAGVLPTV